MIDLELFCETDQDTRYAVQSPWNHRGYKYATDGRIIVRQPTTEPDASDGLMRPNVESIFKPFAPTEPWPEIVPLEECDNVQKVCALAIRLHEIGGRKIQGVYAAMIQTLGLVMYDPRGTPYDMIRFCATDGIEGCVMPVCIDPKDKRR